MISVTSQHALRSLIHLARLPEGEMILGKDLSERGEVPATYLSKILLTLSKTGMVEAVRGSGGGYRLKKPAKDIRLIDVVELFDGIASRPACFLDKHRECRDDVPCPVHCKYRTVRKAYIRFLENTSILALVKAGATKVHRK